jgi:hypothetical protein
MCASSVPDFFWEGLTGTMRYIDTGTRDPSHALGSWLKDELNTSVAELRWQTGFFSGEVIGLLAPTLERLAESNQPVTAVVGSNGGLTFSGHILDLSTAMGVPRTGAKLGVVTYGGAFYHPKTPQDLSPTAFRRLAVCICRVG